ncbi:MAG: hypothetical protein J6A89_05185 [Clostridia bacterium]|nr:hypothetical protein [Clostridia bacterium]
MAGKFWGMQVRKQRVEDGYHIKFSYDGTFLVYKVANKREKFIESFSREDVNSAEESDFLKKFKKVAKKITSARTVDISITHDVKNVIENAIR